MAFARGVVERMKTLKASAAYVLAIALLLPALAYAQAEGRFVGVVLDPSGAVIPGATVVVKNERTGEERTVTSNAEGRYIVANLKPSCIRFAPPSASWRLSSSRACSWWRRRSSPSTCRSRRPA